MPRTEKEVVPEVAAKDATLENILKDLRNNELQAIELVKHLEGVAFEDNEQNRNFCKSYAIAVIQTYCKDTTTADVKQVGGGFAGSAEDKAELMLAACGLLNSFGFKPNCLGDRVHDYYAHAHGYNDLIKGVWKGPSIDKMTRDRLDGIAWELTNTLYDLKIKTEDGKLGFLDNVPKELKLPPPRGNNKPGKQPKTALSGFAKQLAHTLQSIKGRHLYLGLSICLMVIFGFTIAASLVKLAFFPTVPLPVPETANYPSISSVPVEEIISKESPFTVYPGLTVRLPLEISPDEADCTFLYCSSSDSNILYTEDGNKAWVTALEISDPKVPKAKVTVTVTPQNRASSDVFVEVPVIVDYRRYVLEPFN